MRGAFLVILVAAGCGKSDARPSVPADAGVQRTPAPDGRIPDASTAGVQCTPAEALPCVPDDRVDLGESGSATTPVNGESLHLVPSDFAALPEWAADHHAEAVPSFLASCAVLAKLDDDDPIAVVDYAGRARVWRRACAAAAKLTAGDDAAARVFFEAEFAVYVAEGKDGPDGKMTSYNVQEARASRTRHGAYQYPIWSRPPELVSVDLTKFVKGMRGKRVWGRLDDDGALVPYHTRAEIRRGALDGRGLELLWLDDPVDALFMNIEGSGKATLDDGSLVWIEFAGKNGRGYRGVGKLLRDSGELQKGEGTMQGIRAWFEAHPDRLDEIMDQNSSMVFFAISKQPGAVGSQGVVLTPRRSIAIDRSFIAHSTPIWVDTRAPVPGQKHEQPWRHLLIAQDTGGGILGPVRGDLYMGDDADAADISGRMGGAGRYWLLLPRGLKVKTK